MVHYGLCFYDNFPQSNEMDWYTFFGFLKINIGPIVISFYEILQNILKIRTLPQNIQKSIKKFDKKNPKYHFLMEKDYGFLCNFGIFIPIKFIK